MAVQPAARGSMPPSATFMLPMKCPLHNDWAQVHSIFPWERATLGIALALGLTIHPIEACRRDR